MHLNGSTFRFSKKKKQPSQEALKLLSMISAWLLALYQSLQHKVEEQTPVVKKKQTATNERNAAVLTGFVTGALVGSLAALLFAPETGSKFRQRISNLLQDDQDQDIEEAIENARQKAREQLGNNGDS